MLGYIENVYRFLEPQLKVLSGQAFHTKMNYFIFNMQETGHQWKKKLLPWSDLFFFFVFVFFYFTAD